MRGESVVVYDADGRFSSAFGGNFGAGLTALAYAARATANFYITAISTAARS
jgi:hypothetical protein